MDNITDIDSKEQKEMLQIKTTVMETKNAFDELISQSHIAEKRSIDLKIMSIEIPQNEKQKKEIDINRKEYSGAVG